MYFYLKMFFLTLTIIDSFLFYLFKIGHIKKISIHKIGVINGSANIKCIRPFYITVLQTLSVYSATVETLQQYDNILDRHRYMNDGQIDIDKYRSIDKYLSIQLKMSSYYCNVFTVALYYRLVTLFLHSVLCTWMRCRHCQQCLPLPKQNNTFKYTHICASCYSCD